ncbi:MAG TPA: hypothetical protein VE075_03580 [Thermoanaerobaculia bacterium]|nr:hypothetical protein [Thermoanaerobaculia bacterium]
MTRARWRVLACLILSLGLAGCAKLFSSEGTESAAKTRVRFILQTIKEHGTGTDTALQTAVCRWRNDKVFIALPGEQAEAVEAFDAWRQQGGIYPDLQTFEVAEQVQERHDADPEGTYYVTATINGVSRLLRVPPKAQIAWADGVAPPPAGAGAKPAVTFSEAELRRKRAEWEEHERMAEQSQAELQAWRRSRAPAGEQAVPRVGAAKPVSDPASELLHAMQSWHRRYTQRSTAVSLALSQFGMAARENPPDMPRKLAACRDLRAASQALLGDPPALAAPLATVSGPLTTAYTEIQAAAVACLAYRADEQASHLAAARQAMAQAGAALRQFQLTP